MVIIYYIKKCNCVTFFKNKYFERMTMVKYGTKNQVSSQHLTDNERT